MKRTSFLLIVIMSLALCACTRDTAPSQAQSSFICAAGQDYAVADGRLITADRGSVKCFDLSGNVELEHELEQMTAALSANENSAAAYCVGGKTVVLSSGEVIRTEYAITSASVSKGAMTAVCTGCPGYKGLVTVYSKDAQPVYRWYSANADVTAAQVSPDGDHLAVLTSDEVHIFSLDSVNENGLFKAPETMRAVCWADDEVCVIGSQEVYFCDTDGDMTGEHRFDGMTTGIYSMLDDKLIIQLSDAEGAETVYIIDGDDIDGSASAAGQILGIDCGDDEILVLTQDTVSIYDDKGKLLNSMKVPGSEAAFLLDDGRMLTVGGGTAQIFKL